MGSDGLKRRPLWQSALTRRPEVQPWRLARAYSCRAVARFLFVGRLDPRSPRDRAGGILNVSSKCLHAPI